MRFWGRREPVSVSLPISLLRVGGNELALRIQARPDFAGYLTPIWVGELEAIQRRLSVWLAFLALFSLALGAVQWVAYRAERRREWLWLASAFFVFGVSGLRWHAIDFWFWWLGVATAACCFACAMHRVEGLERGRLEVGLFASVAVLTALALGLPAWHFTISGAAATLASIVTDTRARSPSAHLRPETRLRDQPAAESRTSATGAGPPSIHTIEDMPGVVFVGGCSQQPPLPKRNPMNEIARSVRRSVLVLSTLTGSCLPLPAGAAATFQVAVLTSADTLGCYDDSDFPPESDAGAVPIGPPPGSSSGSQSAAAAAGLASGQGFASGQALLTAPGSLAGAVLRAEATMQAVAPAGGVCAPQANGGARSRVAYADVLDVSGPSPATPVTLRVSLELDGAMQRAGLSAANHVQPSFGDTGTPAQPIEQLLCTNRNGPCAETDTGERMVLTGIPHPISLELFTQVNVAPSIIGDLFANSSSEFSSTLPAHRGRLCIDLLTPGSDLYTGEWRRPALRVRPVRRPGAASSGTRSAAARARGDGPPRATAARLRRVAAAEGRSRANDLS